MFDIMHSECMHWAFKKYQGYVFKYSNEHGSVIKTYDNVKAVALDLKISCSSIYEVLRGIRKETRSGYSFRYHYYFSLF